MRAVMLFPRMRPVICTDPCRIRAEALKIPFSSTPAPQRGVESRDIYKLNLAPRYPQRVKSPERGSRTVLLDFFRKGKFSPVLAVEPSRALRPCGAHQRRAEQQARSHQFRHQRVGLCSFALAGRQQRVAVAAALHVIEDQGNGLAEPKSVDRVVVNHIVGQRMDQDVETLAVQHHPGHHLRKQLSGEDDLKLRHRVRADPLAAELAHLDRIGG